MFSFRHIFASLWYLRSHMLCICTMSNFSLRINASISSLLKASRICSFAVVPSRACVFIFSDRCVISVTSAPNSARPFTNIGTLRDGPPPVRSMLVMYVRIFIVLFILLVHFIQVSYLCNDLYNSKYSFDIVDKLNLFTFSIPFST